TDPADRPVCATPLPRQGGQRRRRRNRRRTRAICARDDPAAASLATQYRLVPAQSMVRGRAVAESAPSGMHDIGQKQKGIDMNRKAKPESSEIHLQRAYEEPGSDDGYRVLVDHYWPRGRSK